MAAPYNPPVKGEDFITYIFLPSATSAPDFVIDPSIAAGDFKVAKDDGSFVDLTTTPTVSPAGSRRVKITLSSTEMTADNVSIQGIDQTSPKVWADFGITIVTTA